MKEAMPIRYEVDIRRIPRYLSMERDCFTKHFLRDPSECLAYIYSQEYKRIQVLLRIVPIYVLLRFRTALLKLVHMHSRTAVLSGLLLSQMVF